MGRPRFRRDYGEINIQDGGYSGIGSCQIPCYNASPAPDFDQLSARQSGREWEVDVVAEIIVELPYTIFQKS